MKIGSMGMSALQQDLLKDLGMRTKTRRTMTVVKRSKFDEPVNVKAPI